MKTGFVRNRYSKNSIRIVAGLLAVGFFQLSLWNPAFIQNLRYKVYDAFLRQYPGEHCKQLIRVVAIDDKSLTEYGQWPWPRHIMARALTLISKGKPKVIGLDIVFAEPDRLSPSGLAVSLNNAALSTECRQSILALPDNDQQFAKALKKSHTVLGYPFSLATGSDAAPPPPPGRKGGISIIGTDPLPWLLAAQSRVGNLPLLELSAHSSGFFNVLPDEDGIVRRIPMLMKYGNDIYPSLALEMLRSGEGAPTIQLRCHATGMESIKISSHTIPTDARGRLSVRFCGQENPFPTTSISELLKGRVNPAIFKNAYVLIGTTASTLSDVVHTPLWPQVFGVNLHGDIINTILSGSFPREPDWSKGAELIYLIIASAVIIVLIPAVGALKSGLVLFILGAGISFFSYYCFSRFGFFLDLVYPLGSIILLFSFLTFLNYCREEKKRKITRAAFSKYLSPALVNKLLKHPEQLALSGEECHISILFADIRNFTSISENMTPRETCTFLNRYMTPMTEVLLKHKATLDKYLGDMIMAFWNAPLDDADHVFNSCRAAIMMTRTLKVLNKKWLLEGLQPVKNGIGLHTGIALVGNMGSDQHFDFTVMGDTVNLARRLESITKLYGVTIIVSEAIYNMVKDRGLVFRKLDKIRVVGKKQPVTIYELVEEAARISPALRSELTKYEKALESYFAGDFNAALSAFEELEKIRPNRLYRVCMDRTRDYLQNPPSPSWDGATTFLTK